MAGSANLSETVLAAHRMVRPPVGIGLRAPHYQQLLDEQPSLSFLEVHSENYFGDGGAPLRYLGELRDTYPISLHGVGLSLGSCDPLNRDYLSTLKNLINRIEPVLVSDHLSWCSLGGVYFNDLLPLPYTSESLAHVCDRVSQTQDIIGRQLLVENPSTYLQFADSDIPEWEFLSEVARRSGCGILLDANNLYVNCTNHGWSSGSYLAALPVDAVREIHVAGHAVRDHDGGRLLIDTHGSPVADAVWNLYRSVVDRFGLQPTLVEWDNDLPPLAQLLSEAAQARDIAAGIQHAA